MKTNFKPKTWAVINKLKTKIDEAKFYPTLGHFYREIELLKFPWLADVSPKSHYYSKTGRNVFTQQQYETIVDYCVGRGWVSIEPNIKRKGSYVVYTHLWKIAGMDNRTNTQRKETNAAIGITRKPTHGTFSDSEVTNDFKVELSLDPSLNWVVRTVNGKSYLTVK